MGIPFAIDQWHRMMKKISNVDSKSWEADCVDGIELAEAIVNRWPDRTYAHRDFDKELSSKLNSFAETLPNLEVPDLLDKFLLVLAERDWITDLKKSVTNALKKLEVDDVFASLKDFIRIEPAPNEYGIWFRDGIPVRDANWLLLLAKRKNRGGLSAEQLGGLLDTAVARIVAQANRFKVGKHCRSNSPNESWLALCKALIAVRADGLLERLLQLLSNYPNVFDLRQFQVTAAVDLLAFAAKTNDSVPKSLTTWTAQLRSVLEKATKSKPKPPTDFRRESNTSCECRFCLEMKSFLENATQPKTRIVAAERSREHLTDVIRRRGLDVSTKTVRTGSPYSLELTKTTTGHREKVQRYKTDLKLLDRLT